VTGRPWTGGRLVIASHNQGKVAEIQALLASFDAEIVSAAVLGLVEPEETGQSFVDNALLKARAATLATGLPALADDSGLAVAALGGEPGIYSARWAGPTRDFSAAMAKIEQALAGRADRRAQFHCALALAWPDGHAEVVEGTVAGLLVWPPRGRNGFGYDPMFVATGQTLTFGEMAPADKHRLSHRHDAFAQLVARCFCQP
jgi:XTP/dITP diphosphohydrolase